MKRVAALVLLPALLVAGCSSPTTPAPGAPATSSTVAAPPNVVGKPLDEARTTLSAEGWTVEVYDAVEDRMILAEGNWTVSEQALDGTTVRLGAKKDADDEPSSEPLDEKARAAAVKAYLLESFGVGQFTDLLTKDPTLWAGYIADIRVERGNLYVTVQEDDKALGEDAANALSTLVTKELADGLGFVVVENGAHAVLAQEKLKPLV